MEDVKLDHIVLAVRDLERSKRILTTLFNPTFIKEVELPDQNARAAYYLLGEVVLGLETPLSNSGDLYRFLEKRGEGIHHIALHTDNIQELQKNLSVQDIKLLGNEEVPSIKREFFTHPKSSLGILFQIMEWEKPYRESLQKRLEILGEEKTE